LVLLQNTADDLKTPLLQSLKQLVAKQSFLESNVGENAQALADHRLLAIRECLRMKEPLRQTDSLRQLWKAATQAPDFEDSFEKLRKFGLVTEQDQKLKPSSPSYVYSPQKSNEAVRHYHSGWLGSAHHALNHLPADERYFQGSTVAIRSDAYQEIVGQLDLLHKKILSLAMDDQADQVLHIGSFAIPVTGRSS
jgi:uncharacterized protein (TIGR02147 family)